MSDRVLPARCSHSIISHTRLDNAIVWGVMLLTKKRRSYISLDQLVHQKVMAFHDGLPGRRWILFWPSGSLKCGVGRLCSTRSWTSNDQLAGFCIPAGWYDPTTVARFRGPKRIQRTPALRFLAFEVRPPFASRVLRLLWQPCRWRGSSPSTEYGPRSGHLTSNGCAFRFSRRLCCDTTTL